MTTVCSPAMVSWQLSERNAGNKTADHEEHRRHHVWSLPPTLPPPPPAITNDTISFGFRNVNAVVFYNA